MNQTQILTIQRFIMIAHIDINNHKNCRDHASHRVMMFSYGRAIGAYAMCGSALGSDTHTKVQRLDEAYQDAMSLTLHKN